MTFLNPTVYTSLNCQPSDTQIRNMYIIRIKINVNDNIDERKLRNMALSGTNKSRPRSLDRRPCLLHSDTGITVNAEKGACEGKWENWQGFDSTRILTSV